MLKFFVRLSAVVIFFLGTLSATFLRADPMDRAVLGRMDAQINSAIAEKKLPGAVIWVEHQGDIYHKAFGDRAVDPGFEEMTRDTIFDAASLTKVVAGMPAIMILVERGQVKLEERVSTYIPEFKGGGKEEVTVKQLLTHLSGLRPDVDTKTKWEGNDAAIRLASEEKLANPPGEKLVYSDINLFLVGEIVHRVSKMKLNDFVAKEIYQPLKMVDTGYLPSKEKIPRIAPTERSDGKMLRGVVHDPTARYMGGVAGHAGIFTTAADLARYARMILNNGELEGVRIFKPETIQLMTTVQTPPGIPMRRGLGWDIDSDFSRPRGERFPLGSFGHTGFTGNAFWIDPFSKSFWIFLSNRVHPDGKGSVVDLYKSLGTLAAEAVTDFDFSYVPNALRPRIAGKSAEAKNEINNEVPGVLNGIDVLEKQNFGPLKGMRVGLITNHTGKNRMRYPTIDLLMNAPDVQLKALFAPEHGLYGLLDEAVADSVDERTGLPVYSLYGKNRAPTVAQVRGLDALVFDIQDVGCRFYTYISTMGLTMEAAGQNGLKFFVLDRVNPIRGDVVDGPMLTGKTSFVGYHALPLRYGMTIGELARMFKAERKLNTDLTVIPMEGWTRRQWFDETAQPWGNLSPNMRNLTEATLYAGVGVLETTSVSVGRGTDTPFEVLGAPYIHDLKLAYELNQAGLKGVRFVPVRFTPNDSVFKNQSCAGVNIILTDRDHCEVADIGISIAKILNRWYPEQFGLKKMDRLLINEKVLAAIKEDKPLSEIKKLYAGDLEDFARRREPFLLYK
ncbi:MAG: exo-beta-N-acetylmuramidase NamZ domain-containing protein [Verrucomicrobiota bacterium]